MPQQQAFETEADETLYGGQAGGGKTELLLGLASTRHKRSVIFRRQKGDAQALIERCGEILGDFGRWNGQDRAYRTNEDRFIEFGHCSRPGDEQSWQGRPHDLKAFDELAHFSKYQYLFLSAWNRSSNPRQRCRVVGATNPPTTAEGLWIIERWAPWLDKKHPNPARSGELRWFAMIDGVDTEVVGPEPFEHTSSSGKVERIEPRSRTFIPAGLDDNPYYRNSAYRAVLQAMPEPLRSILLEGRFDAAMEDDPWQVIPTAWVEAAMARWTPEPPRGVPMSAMGVDVARGGSAKTVMQARHGVWFAQPKAVPGIETPTGVAAAGVIVRELRDDASVQIDNIGIGASAYDQLDQIGVNVVAMDAREGTEATDRSGRLKFFNMRAKWWWDLRESLDPETGDNIALPPDNEMKADLCGPHWEPTQRGVKVEAKEDVEGRLSRSVDKGDAVVMAWQEMRNPRNAKRSTARPAQANNRYSPTTHWRRGR
jgi:hypothetical protein